MHKYAYVKHFFKEICIKMRVYAKLMYMVKIWTIYICNGDKNADKRQKDTGERDRYSFSRPSAAEKIIRAACINTDNGKMM